MNCETSGPKSEAEKSTKTSGEKSGPKRKGSERSSKAQQSHKHEGEQLSDGWAEAEKSRNDRNMKGSNCDLHEQKGALP